MNALTVGAHTIVPIHDGTAVLDPAMFTVSDQPTDWQAQRHALDGDGKFRVPVGAFVVRTNDRVIMLDAGIGVTKDEMFDGGQLLDNLVLAGFATTDIDTIIVSHLHSDHMGWLESEDQPTFPNATVHIGAADWEHFVVNALGGRRRAERLRSIEDRVELIDRDGLTIAPGFTTRATPGHTPGHTSTVISSGDERMIVLGDALHCPAQLTETEWQFLYDVDKSLASSTRAALLREAEQPNTSLLPCHFPNMAAARLVSAQGTKQWVVGA